MPASTMKTNRAYNGKAEPWIRVESPASASASEKIVILDQHDHEPFTISAITRF